MQVPPVIPSVSAPAPNELKPEPVTRITPVVMGDAAVVVDPSVILKTPVPVSQGPRMPNAPRSPTDQEGPIYAGSEEAEGTDSNEHVAKLLAQLKRAESGAVMVRWPTPYQRTEQQLTEPGLARQPRPSLEALKQGLKESPMLALHQFAVGSQPDVVALLNRVPTQGSADVGQALSLLMHGQLLWQGEFTPGVHGRVYREDAYGADPRNPGGPLAKGTQISVELTLPNLGKLIVRGAQIADSVNVLIEPHGPGQFALKSQFGELQSQMESAQLGFVNLQLKE